MLFSLKSIGYSLGVRCAHYTRGVKLAARGLEASRAGSAPAWFSEGKKSPHILCDAAVMLQV